MGDPRGCVACEIVAGRRSEPGGVLYQDDNWHAGSVLQPVVWRGFTIVKLKRHCEHIAALTGVESDALGPVLRAGCAALMQVLQPAKVYVCSFGDGVQHIHFWLLPRPPAMQPGMHAVMFHLDVRTTFTRLLGVKRWLVPPADIDATAEQIRTIYQQLLP